MKLNFNFLRMESRLITPQLANLFEKQYPLYSQDGLGRNAMCVAIFFIGKIRWYVLEGQPEGDDFTLFTIVCGMYQTEYGYSSVKEMEGIKVDGSRYGLPNEILIESVKDFVPCKLSDIQDSELQQYLDAMEPA